MRRTGILGFLVIAACSDASTALMGPTTAQDAANATIRLRVIGDPDLFSVGAATYFVQIDSAKSRDIYPLEPVRIQVTPGLHTVRAVRERIVGCWAEGIFCSSGFEPWCDLAPPYSQEKSLVAGANADVEFVVDCPSRDGNGIVRLTLTARGEERPDSARVDFISKVPGLPSVMVMVPTNMETTIPLAAGAYRLDVDAPRCPFAGGPSGAMDWPFVLRVDSTKTISVTLPCPVTE